MASHNRYSHKIEYSACLFSSTLLRPGINCADLILQKHKLALKRPDSLDVFFRGTKKRTLIRRP